MIPTVRLALLASAALLGFTATAAAKTIYVNNVAGSDRFDGSIAENVGNNQGPVATIGQALRLAAANDRIVVAGTGQPYQEQVSLYGRDHSGTQEVPFVIESDGAILDGTEPVPLELWEHHRGDVFRFRSPYSTYLQCYSHGIPMTKVPLSRFARTPPKLKPGQYCVFAGHVYLHVHEGKTPRDYDVSYTARQVGITIYAVENVVVSGFVVQGFRLDGVNVHDLSRGVQLVEVTARGNGRSGVSVGGSSRVELLGSQVGDNGAAQLRTEGYGELTVVGSQIIDNTAPAWQMEGGQLSIDGRVIDR